MSTMDMFFSLVLADDQTMTDYQKLLSAITRIDLEILHKIVSDLGWQQWGEYNEEPG